MFNTNTSRCKWYSQNVTSNSILHANAASGLQGTDQPPLLYNISFQVRVMLEKVDLDGTSDISSNLSESTAYSDNKKIKSKKPRYV